MNTPKNTRKLPLTATQQYDQHQREELAYLKRGLAGKDPHFDLFAPAPKPKRRHPGSNRRPGDLK